jgi:hypothetical protein
MKRSEKFFIFLKRTKNQIFIFDQEKKAISIEESWVNGEEETGWCSI